MKQEKAGTLSIIIVGILWGTIGIFVQEMKNYGANIETISFIRVLFATLIMFVVCYIKCGLKSFIIDKKSLLSCVLLGLICHGIYNVFYSIAVTKAGVSISAVLLDIAPVFTFIFSVLLFKEKIKLYKLAGILLNVTGCVLAVSKSGNNMNNFVWIGILCGIGAGLTYSLTPIIGRLAGKDTNIFIMSFYSYLSASIFLCIYMVTGEYDFVLNKEVVIIGILFALIPTVIAYLIYYWGVKRISNSSKIPVFASMEILVACLLGVICYQESLQGLNIIGIFLVICSVIIMR